MYSLTSNGWWKLSRIDFNCYYHPEKNIVFIEDSFLFWSVHYYFIIKNARKKEFEYNFKHGNVKRIMEIAKEDAKL